MSSPGTCVLCLVQRTIGLKISSLNEHKIKLIPLLMTFVPLAKFISRFHGTNINSEWNENRVNGNDSLVTFHVSARGDRRSLNWKDTSAVKLAGRSMLMMFYERHTRGLFNKKRFLFIITGGNFWACAFMQIDFMIECDETFLLVEFRFRSFCESNFECKFI